MDQQNEAARLAQRYAAMSDEALEEIAAGSGDLTDDARTVLQRELEKRGMNVEISDSTAPHPPELGWQKWVMVKRFRDLPEAMLAKGSLDSAGIECHLTDDNMVRLDWFISNLLGGAKLMVKPEDLEEARQILEQPIPEGFDYGEEHFEQPKCPRCGSLDITFEDLNKPIAYGSAWLGVPLPIKSEKWICNACGARWVEEEEPDNKAMDRP